MWSFLLGLYLGVEVLGHRVEVFLAVVDTVPWFCKEVEPVLTPISNVCDGMHIFLILHMCWGLGWGLSDRCRVHSSRFMYISGDRG